MPIPALPILLRYSGILVSKSTAPATITLDLLSVIELLCSCCFLTCIKVSLSGITPSKLLLTSHEVDVQESQK